MKNYDVIVIGTGGGNGFADIAARIGKKVAVIEKERTGGTCLNRGCIPSKMIIHPANVIREMEHAHEFPISSQVKAFFPEIIKRVSENVDSKSDNMTKGIENSDRDFYHGTASFLSDNVIEVNGEQLQGELILISVGSRPMIPDIKGLSEVPYWTSTEALRAKKLPKRLAVLGGGYIACELAHAYSAFGSKVDMIVRSQLLRREDKSVGEEFTKAFSKTHQLHLESSVKEVQFDGKEYTITLDNGKELVADAFLVATGVIPNSDTLNLENTGVQVDSKGFIKVDDEMQTDVKGVYAIGDVAGNYLFRHSVNFERDYLINHVLGGMSGPIKYPPMPSAVFTYPEIASVGLREDDADDSVLVVSNNYSSTAQGWARMTDHGFVKLLFDKKSKTLVGAHILGAEASNLIHMLVYAMTHKGTIDHLLDMIYIHPALPEVIKNAVKKADSQLE